MSLTGKLFTLSDANIATVIDDPTLLKQIVSPGEAPTGLLGQWFGGLRKPKKSAKQLHFGPGENESIYLDRAWHSLHYLFTGKVDAGGTPLDFLVEGGTLVEHPDILYVQARLSRRNRPRQSRRRWRCLMIPPFGSATTRWTCISKKSIPMKAGTRFATRNTASTASCNT